MGYIQKQIAYLKDNPKGYWFKRKLYGWGWTPAKWQGWATLLVFIALLTLNTIRFDVNKYQTETGVVYFILETLALIFLLVLVCIKTGEKPKWQWGGK